MYLITDSIKEKIESFANYTLYDIVYVPVYYNGFRETGQIWAPVNFIIFKDLQTN